MQSLRLKPLQVTAVLQIELLVVFALVVKRIGRILGNVMDT